MTAKQSERLMRKTYFCNRKEIQSLQGGNEKSSESRIYPIFLAGAKSNDGYIFDNFMNDDLWCFRATELKLQGSCVLLVKA